MTRRQAAEGVLLVGLLLAFGKCPDWIAAAASGGDPIEADWIAREVHYVAQGLVGCAAFIRWGRATPCLWIAVLAWFAAWEELQIAACGVGSTGIDVPIGTGLCLVRMGSMPYQLVASASVATLGVLLWSPRAFHPIRSRLARPLWRSRRSRRGATGSSPPVPRWPEP